MVILSRKICHSIRRGVEAIHAGSFTEREIKLLMIELREIALSLKGLEDKLKPGAPRPLAAFVEIAHFVAHSNKDRGDFEERIRSHAERTVDAYARGDERMPIVTGVPHANLAAMGLLIAAMEYLRTYDARLSIEDVMPKSFHFDEIGLCIASLLQDSAITLKNGNGTAGLNFMVHKGFYRLYCYVLGSKFQETARSQTASKVNISLNFPVLLVNAVNVEQILPYEVPYFTHQQVPTPPRLLEAFRSPSGLLMMRELDGLY